MRDVDRYPHILDRDVWHRRRADDAGDGPVYPTRCGLQVRTFGVDDPDGAVPEEWQTRCQSCYPDSDGTAAAIKRVNFVEESTGVKVDDPAVVRAMEVYDHLDDIERRDFYTCTIQAMAAYRRTGEESHLTALTRMHEEMVRVDAIPGLREKFRATRNGPPPKPAKEADIEALITRLGREDTSGTQ